MAVTKSVIESFTLNNGMEVWVQLSIRGNIALSFDGNDSSFNVRMTADEAEKLQELIGTVIQEGAL